MTTYNLTMEQIRAIYAAGYDQSVMGYNHYTYELEKALVKILEKPLEEVVRLVVE